MVPIDVGFGFGLGTEIGPHERIPTGDELTLELRWRRGQVPIDLNLDLVQLVTTSIWTDTPQLGVAAFWHPWIDPPHRWAPLVAIGLDGEIGRDATVTDDQLTWHPTLQLGPGGRFGIEHHGKHLDIGLGARLAAALRFDPEPEPYALRALLETTWAWHSSR